MFLSSLCCKLWNKRSKNLYTSVKKVKQVKQQEPVKTTKQQEQAKKAKQQEQAKQTKKQEQAKQAKQQEQVKQVGERKSNEINGVTGLIYRYITGNQDGGNPYGNRDGSTHQGGNNPYDK